MNSAWDFILFLGVDLSMYILMCLDDPSDLARVCLVSSSWCHFVIEKGLFKSLFLKLFPDISTITHIIEEKIVPVQIRAESSPTWKTMERDHKVYGSLSRGLHFERQECISRSIYAASAIRFQYTSKASDRHYVEVSYRPGEGASDPPVLESLLFQLISKFCVITEVTLRQFQERLRPGISIYSAKAVRFRMGHNRTMIAGCDTVIVRDASVDNFIWTYTSPVFPLAQENDLQTFKLPEPVLCIGGYLAIDLLGPVQRQAADGRYLLSVANVQVLGRSLSPAFDVEIIDGSGSCTLKYKQSAAQQSLGNSITSPMRTTSLNLLINSIISQHQSRFRTLNSQSEITTSRKTTASPVPSCKAATKSAAARVRSKSAPRQRERERDESEIETSNKTTASQVPSCMAATKSAAVTVRVRSKSAPRH